ncbi:MAG: DNA recombination protein RmuC [Parcubacteria group bacterium]|nr:DNA recombination protein RmuC [Parcubacteria group bacterium]
MFFKEIVLIFILFAIVVVLASYFLNKKFKALEAAKEKDKDGTQQVLNTVLELLKVTQGELRATREDVAGNLHRNKQSVESQMAEHSRAMNDRLDNAAKVIREVGQELGKLKEVGHGLKDLQDFLRSPKLRGNIGERVLCDLLSQCFPQEYFCMQYRFGDGQIVDAVIKTDKGMIPIDSKFPMENFLKMCDVKNQEEYDAFSKEFFKDVKKHIQDIAKKYILPNEGTVDFAVIYIPSEAVYYEIIRNNIELQNFAYEKKVFPVSPNTFYAFLKVILMGLEGKKIESAAQRILETLDGIRVANDKFSGLLSTLTSHINNSKNMVDRVNNEYARLSSQIENVKLLK